MIRVSPLLPLLFLLALAVEAGARTRVRVEGTRAKSERQVLDLLGDRLFHINNGRATPSRADDAAFLVRQVLLNDGYADVRVDWRVAGPDEIVLTVSEGARRSLGEVTVEGLEGDEASQMARLFTNPAVKNRPIGLGSEPFREDDVGEGIDLVRQDLQARGYWAAEVREGARRLDPETGEVDIDLVVDRGPMFTIGEHRVTSVDGRGVVRVGTTVRPYVGMEATTANVNAMRSEVEEVFVTLGYPDARIRMGRQLVGTNFVPDFEIDLGTRVRLNEIHVAGLEKTRPNRIIRYFENRRGDWYDEAAMNEGLRRLLATGAFSSARVETTQVAERRVDATLRFEEARAKEISLAAGVGSYEGIITRATYTDRNLGGRLLGFSAGVEASLRGFLGEMRVTDPWFLGEDLTMSTRLYSMIFDHEGYDSFETGLETSLRHAFNDHYTMELMLGWSIVNLSPDGLPSDELGETVYNHLRLRLTQTLDFRDHPVLTKSGWYVQSPIQIGSAVGDRSSSYIRADLQGAWYHQLNDKTGVALGARTGLLVPTGDSRKLPIDLRLFNGGAQTIRSFPERELGPQVNGYATGGEAAWSANAELIRTLAGPVKGVAFLDAGALSREWDRLGSADLELAAGLGLRIELPIGPVRLEYGHNLTRDAGEPSGAFHFAIGASF